MLRLLTDENFNGSILRGLMRRKPEIDIVRVQDVGLSGVDDHAVLAWAAREGRVLLTHDQATVPKYAYERIEAGLPMSGAFVGDTHLSVQHE
jgi:predicted nuclease of predicted toxin-antitoxin system